MKGKNMEKQFWTLFYLSLIGLILICILLIVSIVFSKRIFLQRKYGSVLLVVSVCTLLLFGFLTAKHFVECYKDLSYVTNDTYIEEECKVIEYTRIERDLDGNGQISYNDPKLYVIDTDEYIILHLQGVEVGETYLIRYYPNTKICEVVEKIS